MGTKPHCKILTVHRYWEYVKIEDMIANTRTRNRPKLQVLMKIQRGLMDSIGCMMK